MHLFLHKSQTPLQNLYLHRQFDVHTCTSESLVASSTGGVCGPAWYSGSCTDRGTRAGWYQDVATVQHGCSCNIGHNTGRSGYYNVQKYMKVTNKLRHSMDVEQNYRGIS